MRKAMRKKRISGIVAAIFVLFFLLVSFTTTSSQIGFTPLVLAFGAMILGLWIGASTIARTIRKILALFEKPFAKRPFARFLIKKVLFLLVTIFFVYTLLFIIVQLAPTNPVDVLIAKMARNPNMNPIQLATSREKYYALFGLDKSPIEQYALSWKRILTMDYGPSYCYFPRTVGSLIWSSLGWTLVLIIPAWITSFIVGNYLGARAAFSKNKLLHAWYIFSVYLNSAPYYWFALILVYGFAVSLGLFPTARAYTPGLEPSLNLKFISDTAHHYALPFLSIFIAGIGNWCTGMRAMTIYERQSDYTYYSQQMGFSERRVRQYAQRNAILPQVTGLPIILSSLIGQTMLVEIVFNWPGLGLLFYSGARSIDYPLLEGALTMAVVIVLIGNLLMDIIYGFIDPRIRTGYVGG
jgi:peptide/nickel transport system permease protein